MSAKIQYEPVAVCTWCHETSIWQDDAFEWAEEHNREEHPEEGTPDE